MLLTCIRTRNVRKHVSFSYQSITRKLLLLLRVPFTNIMQKYLQIPLLLIQSKIYSSKKQRHYMCVTFLLWIVLGSYSVTSGLPIQHYRWCAGCKSRCRRNITKPQYLIQQRRYVKYALQKKKPYVNNRR